jgi:hypothetical protein
MFAAMVRRVSSDRELLGWEPKRSGLISNIDQPGYFEFCNGPAFCDRSEK